FVGLRFQKLGVPPKATITSASIQFSAAQPDAGTADLAIRVVNSASADPFTGATDLTTLDSLGDVPWAPLAWAAANERGGPETTADLAKLVQMVVQLPGYAPDSAIAFVVTGSGRRIARAVEGLAAGGRPATLTVAYAPPKIGQDFLACGDPADAANICGQKVQSNVTSLAQQCKLSNACTCKVKPVPDSDKTSFGKVCNDPCPKVVAPADCDPSAIAKTTAATDAHTPVCVATSPLGSVLFGQRSACDIDPGQSNVHARIFKGTDSSSGDAAPRGRIEFVGAPCPGDSCAVGMTQRMNVGDMTFPSHNLLASDAVVNQLTAVGESTVGAFVFGDGTGSFSPGLTTHAMRGNEVGGDAVAVVRANDGALAISIGVDPTQPGGWRAGGTCTLEGTMFQAGNQDGGGIEMFVDIKGTLVNQPPTADAGPDRTVECNAIGRGVFTLGGSADDPDNNVASIGWFRGSRIGPLVGMLPSVEEVDQAVGTTTSYVLKVIDTFGQYDEDTTSVTVVDTTPPSVTAPATAQAECTGPAGTPVDIGQATATDACDASPDISNNAPQLFPLGTTTVIWSAIDDSNNVGHATQQVKVADTTPPDLTVQLSPTVLWPPDHKLVTITATITVSDTCDPHPTIRLVSITSNEPDNGLGDGDQPDDIQAVFDTDDRVFLLRSERG
ncbi:MAG TPA: HYR domain-containing protein, partial [Acidimicrobiales bacterium]|nr:HYR domain-containing protein [Acidimicrobiales bacterium]